MRRAPLGVLALSIAAAIHAACGGEHAPPVDAGDGAAVTLDAGLEKADAAAAADADAAARDAGDARDAGVSDARDAGVSDAGDAGVVDAGPPLPSFADEPFPEKGTPFPKTSEWAGAPAVAIDRAQPATLFATHAADPAPCRAQRIREWVRIHCRLLEGGAVLLGGNRDGLSMRFDKAAGGTEVIVPVRRGDRRVLEMLGTETLTFKMFSNERATFAFVLSEQWPAGDERPTIVAR